MIWTFRKKILLGYGGTLALVVLVFAWAVVSLLELGAASESILRENYKSILAAENMIDAIERQDSSALLLLLGYGEEWSQTFHTNESLFLQHLGRAKDNITIKGEDEIVKGIEVKYTSYLIESGDLLSVSRANPAQAKAYYYEKVHPLFNSILEACIELRELNQKTMFQASRQAQKVAGRAVWSVAVIGLASVAAGLLWSLLLSTLLSRPVRELRQAALRMAEGDYEVEVPVQGADELGLLAEQFNQMAKKVWYYNEFNIGRTQAERQKSEAIIQSVDDGIVVLDGKFEVTSINPMAARIFGLSPQQALGRHFLETVANEQIFAAARETLESGRASSLEDGRDVVSVTSGRSTEHYQFSVVPVTGEAGPSRSVVVLLRDVTRLRELDKLRSEFIMTASHELRTPLMSLGMSVDLLRESAPQKLSQKERELLEAAHEDVQRLKALVNDLLDLSRIESGKVEMDFSRVPVSLLGEKAVAVMQAQAEQRSVGLSVELKEGLPEVKADPNKIVWVLVNLISNALRYTGPGGRIRITAEAVGPQVHISVIDDGQGIPYEYQSKVFDKFVQVREARDAPGSGLGLAICKEIVQAHGGTIWVESVPGEGSTFTFSLPAEG